MLVYKHDSSTKLFWSKANNNAEAKHTGRSSADKKYSRLDEIETYGKINGAYEFKLEYPALGITNIWKQTSNPVLEIKAHGGVKGYQAISVAATSNRWGGLEKSGDSTFLDGTVNHGNWFYAIGSYVSYKGANLFPSNSKAVNLVKLYIKTNLKKSHNCHQTPYVCDVEGGATGCNSCSGVIYYGKRYTTATKPGSGTATTLSTLKAHKYVKREHTEGDGNFPCSNVLGDPNYGYYKHCICVPGGNSQLRIDICDGIGSSEECRSATYSSFSIGSAANGYKLAVSGYSSPNNAGDSLSGHSGYKFTTKDRDQDIWSKNCAVSYIGAWWYTRCHSSNLNGNYGNKAFADGPVWNSWKGYHNPMEKTQMAVSRKSKAKINNYASIISSGDQCQDALDKSEQYSACAPGGGKSTTERFTVFDTFLSNLYYFLFFLTFFYYSTRQYRWILFINTLGSNIAIKIQK